MTMDRLEDRAAIADQMFRYARATDWLETDRHREVFVDDCVFASPHSGDIVGVDAVVDVDELGAGPVRGDPAPDRQHLRSSSPAPTRRPR